MKKYLFVVLMICFPLMSFAAPSVRMLGSGVGSASVPSKTTPVKYTASAPVAATNASARVGTIRSQKNRALGVSGAVTSSGTRFPVINTPKVYDSVDVPKVNNGSSNTTIISGGTCDCPEQIDDPRVDMIKIGQPDGLWTSNSRTNEVYNENGGRAWMWIEVEN